MLWRKTSTYYHIQPLHLYKSIHKQMKRLAIIASHPIDYNAALFKTLTEREKVILKVFYTWSQFKHVTLFDMEYRRRNPRKSPFLEDYDYTFVNNTAPEPGLHHFDGIENPTLIADIEEWNPTAILVFEWSFKSHLDCLHHFHNKIPVLYREETTLFTEKFINKDRLKGINLASVYASIDKALYLGTYNKEYYESYGLIENKLISAPFAIENERFFDISYNYETSADAWRARYNIPVSSMVFLYAGKLITSKGVELLIDAFKSISSPKKHLMIVGNGPLEDDLKKRSAGFANIHFLDFEEPQMMHLVYRLCDVYVLPCIEPGETWGYSVNEAMACSKAVLVSNKACGATDIIQPGANGYIFNTDKEGDLKDKMSKFNDVLETYMMGEKSLYFVKYYSLKNLAIAVEQEV